MYINFVELESKMLQAKFQDHRTLADFDFRDKDFLRFYHVIIWAWWPYWSLDKDHIY